LNLLTRWQRYENELQDLRDISIPRRLISLNRPICLEIHGFFDASEVAFDACIFMRATSPNGEHSTHLLCSKSRVAHLKSISVPRLELCAAVLLAQLVNKVLKCLQCKIDTIYLWTDSTIVLSWIQSCSRTWVTFVANRVAEIQQLTPIQYWHHVRSEENPADSLSRGVMPKALTTLHLWWSGPPWLSQDKDSWSSDFPSIKEEDLPEKRTRVPLATMVATQTFSLFDRYSRLTKLIHVTSYILRFSNNIRKVNERKLQTHSTNSKLKIPPISISEKNQATSCLIRIIQGKYFKKEIHSLTKHRSVKKCSPILRLSPFLDENSILRIGGRLEASNLPYTAKHPILLPGHHPFSHLIVKHEHERQLHAGAQAILAAVRQIYWITSAQYCTSNSAKMHNLLQEFA